MRKHVISCHPSGLMEAVQNDELSLREFGRVQMERASDVTWDEKHQIWKAVIRPEFRKTDHMVQHYGSVGTKENGYKLFRPWVFVHKSREKCIEWELEYLNDR